MDIKFDQLPDLVRSGAAQLFADNIYFVPIRHHSPACALAVKSLLAEIKPALVLIEGPETFNGLIDLLLHPDTHPPVAVFSQTPLATQNANPEQSSRKRATFFPLCDYSPEWVALREGASLGAKIAFIDQPWAEREDRQDSTESSNESLQAERYFAHSEWLNRLAINSGCRDHHELWDHWFELRPAAELKDWRSLLRDVFCWCAMTRLDYEPEVLEAENSLPRERHMASLIKSWRAKIKGAIVVVTGGFHTLELLNWSSLKAQANTQALPPLPEQWLIRYGFAQLDALNNYSAGMPSPAYYQLLWDGLCSEQANPWLAATETLLLELVSRTRQAELAETLSTADLQAAILQALRLADLRGHPGPGRTDLLDAITSCFIKRATDDGQSGLILDTRRLLAGSRLGNIPASAGSPPLVEDARAQAKANGLVITDSESRLAKLDIYRKPKHQVRSRFFHLISYLGVDLARNENGPNFLTGTKLDLLFEDWRYAWSPTVEAQLIELSNSGERLHTAALAKLIEEEQAIGQAGQGRSAAKLVHLLIRACLMGLHEQLSALFKLLEAHLNEDADFNSVVTCGHHLLTLWQAREPLGVKDDVRVLDFLQRVWSAALFLLPSIAAVKAEQEPQTIAQLIGFRELTQRLNKSPQEIDLLLDRLQNITHSAEAAPGVIAGSACILYLEGRWNGQQLAQLTASRLGRGALGEDANRFLNGLMYTAPELLLHEQDLLQSINQLLSHWSESDFIAFLPDLRQSFTQLKPSQTEKLAELLLRLNDAEGEELFQYHQDISERDMIQGLSLQTAFADTLQCEGLAHWLFPAAEGSTHGE